jgi:hypothetical protein
MIEKLKYLLTLCWRTIFPRKTSSPKPALEPPIASLSLEPVTPLIQEPVPPVADVTPAPALEPPPTSLESSLPFELDSVPPGSIPLSVSKELSAMRAGVTVQKIEDVLKISFHPAILEEAGINPGNPVNLRIEENNLITIWQSEVLARNSLSLTLKWNRYRGRARSVRT